MLRIGHAGQARHGLALTAGGHHQDLIVRILVQHVHIDQVSFRNLEFPDAHGHAADVHHAAADKAHPASVTDRAVDDHLHPVDIAGEHGHDDAPAGLRDHLFKRFADFQFAHGVSRALYVRAFAQQRHHALFPVAGKGLQIRYLPVDRRIVHLEVAAADHNARRAGDRDRARAGNGVAHVNKLAGELAQLNGIPRLHHMHRNAFHPVFFQFQVNQRQRQLGTVDM